MLRVHIIVKGRVQGVGYRNWTDSQANQHGLTGWVKNLPSGEVEIEAQGPKEKLDLFIAELQKGPMFARVTSVEPSWLESPDPDLGTFDVRRD